MANLYQKREIVNNFYYRPPDYLKTVDFSDIASEEFLIHDGDRLDIIAEQVYGNPTYWKFIALFNGIGYMFDIVPGQIIRMPYDIKQVIERV